jgi:uncharacterized protein YjbI with pentapeptide repeats
MSTFTIKNRFSGSVIFSAELTAEIAGKEYSFQLGFAVKSALETNADLRYADLSKADLSNADLSKADLSNADLSNANLRYADPSKANLRYADLRKADLSNANLRYADLSNADLSNADLSNANLRYSNLSKADLSNANLSNANLHNANLRYADLSNADLSNADLSKADLSNADLRKADLSKADLHNANLHNADLSKADLSKADLSKADLSNADLRNFKSDLWMTLTQNVQEVPSLVEALRGGRVDGSTYEGSCACLVGTIANAKDKSYMSLDYGSNHPAERWFLMIRKGDKPGDETAGGFASKTALDWILEFCALMGIEISESDSEVVS